MSSTRTSETSADGRFILGHVVKDSWGDFSYYEERWRLVDASYGCTMQQWSNEGDHDVDSVRFSDDGRAVETRWADGRFARLELPSPRAFDAAERELRAAVFAAPDDDAPRRAYADWLRQRGDARGELIALQVAAEPSPRADELLAQHRWQWLCDDGLPMTWEAKLERGFVSELRLQLFQLATLERLLAVEALACVHALNLSISSVPGDAIAERLAAAPQARGLRTLDLFLCRPTDAALAKLRASPHLSRLAHIKR